MKHSQCAINYLQPCSRTETVSLWPPPRIPQTPSPPSCQGRPPPLLPLPLPPARAASFPASPVCGPRSYAPRPPAPQTQPRRRQTRGSALAKLDLDERLLVKCPISSGRPTHMVRYAPPTCCHHPPPHLSLEDSTIDPVREIVIRVGGLFLGLDLLELPLHLCIKEDREHERNYE